MADKKLSELTSITSADIASGDLLLVSDVSAGISKSITYGELTTITTGDLNFADNAKAVFGSDSDLQIYHNGSTGLIFNNTGHLEIRNLSDDKDILLQSDNGSGGIVNYLMVDGGTGEVKLFHYGNQKLATTASGVDVTGTVTADGLTVDGAASVNSNSLTLTGAAPIFKITDSDTNVDHTLSGASSVGNFALSVDANNEGTSPKYIIYIGGTEVFRIEEGGDISFYEDTGTTPKFFWDASAERLGIGNAAPASALDVTGTVTADGLTVDGTSAALIASIENDSTSAGSGGLKVNTASTDASTIPFYVRSGNLNRFRVSGNGDISFYEDTGTTPKLFWDASAESLGIGTTGPAALIDAQGTQSFLGNFQRTNAGVAAIRISGQDGESVVIQMGDVSDGDIQRITSDNSDNSMYFHTQNAERLRITSAGNVGIGTSSPSNTTNYATLELSGATGSIVNLTDDGVRVGSFFNTVNDVSIGNFTATGFLGFRTNSTERMRLDANGNLLVGKTATDINTIGHQLLSDGSGDYAAHTSDGTRALLLNRKTSDGTIAEFRRDGAEVGSIGTVGSDLTIGTGDVAIRFQDGSDNLIPHNVSTNNTRDAGINLGTTGARFKDLYLSGGVYLGGTGASNLLDDYEEGTWTPSISVGSATFANTRYIKIGSLVTVYANIADISDNTTNSGIAITGLPFTSVSSNQSTGVSMFRYFDASGKAQMNAYIGGNTTQLEFYWSSESNTSWVNVKYADGGQSEMDIICSISYYTDS